MKVSIRPQQVKDARDFFRILSAGKFAYFPVNVPSIESEKRFLRKNAADFKAGKNFNFTILLDEVLVGAVGIMPESGRQYNAEIGYFIDRAHHGKGIALEAVKQAEQFAREYLPKINRLHAIIAVGNRCSVRVAEKAGYSKEGILKEYLKIGNDFHDAYIFGKIIR